MPSRLKPAWSDVLILVLGYVGLDWASYIHPLHDLNITPWNPAPALGVLVLLRYGRVMVAPLAFSIIAGDVWVRGLPESIAVAAALAVQLALGYWLIAVSLRKVLPGTAIISDRRRLLEWIAIVAGGTLLNSALFVGSLAALGLVPVPGLRESLIQYWVGDAVGMLVTMPILSMVLDAQGRAALTALATRRESLAILSAIGLALWLAFGIGAETDFQYFYALFLPVVWAAARQGVAGAVLSVSVVQIAIIMVVQSLGYTVTTVLEIQTLAVVLALFSFFIGIVVDEQQRMSDDLRHTLRLAAAGEMAGALAHELNQPLTALASYGAACEQLLKLGDTGERLHDVIRRMMAESFRAAEVLRRLRDFFRTGATQLESIPVNDLLDSVATPFRITAGQQKIDFTVGPGIDRSLLGDRLQLEVVLRNLLANAFDAVAGQAIAQKRVRLNAEADSVGRICISVEDSGPGISGVSAARVFDAFQSSKTAGLGLGLAISKAIVEAHGGELWAEVGPRGLFKFVLQSEQDK